MGENEKDGHSVLGKHRLKETSVGLPPKKKKFRTNTIKWDQEGDVTKLKDTLHNEDRIVVDISMRKIT